MAQDPFERLRNANPVPRSMVEGKSGDHVDLLADIPGESGWADARA